MSAARSAVAAAGPGAGTATVIAGGAGGPGLGTKITLSAPCGVASDGNHLVFTDAGQNYPDPGSNLDQIADMVRDLNESTGWMRTVAGIGIPGTDGNEGPADGGELANPCGIAADKAGNLIVVSGISNTTVRLVAERSGTYYGEWVTAGHIYTLPFGGLIAGVAVDFAGNLVFTVPGAAEGPDFIPASVQLLTARSGVFYGQRVKAGQVVTIATLGGLGIGGVTVDAAGNPVVDEGAPTVIAGRSGTFDGRRMRAGGSYSLASGVSGPAALDHSGNFILANGDHQLDVLAMRTGKFYGRRMKTGHVYKFTGALAGLSPDGGSLATARFGDVTGVTVDQAGNWVLADQGNHRVRVVAARAGRFYGQAMKAMSVYTVAGNGSVYSDSGDGGVATRAELSWNTGFFLQSQPINIWGAAADQSSDVFFSDAPNDRVMMVPARSGVFFGRAMRAGNIYPIAGNGVSGDAASGVLAVKANLGNPNGLTVDRDGNVLFADLTDGKIRVVAVTTGRSYGQVMRAGFLYTIAGGGSLRATDGIDATNAQISPEDVKFDGHGNLLFTDDLDGVIWVVPASSGTYYGQPMNAGDIYDIAGGGNSSASGVPATGASLGSAVGLAVDRAGNVLVSEEVSDNLVRVVAASTGTFYGQPMTAGDIYTIAGGGTDQASGGLATSSAIDRPEGLAIDRSGNVLVSLAGQSPLLQVIAVKTGEFYGQPMVAGHLYTISGAGQGLIPANRPAAGIELAAPMGVTVERSGDIVLSELAIGRILLIRG